MLQPRLLSDLCVSCYLRLLMQFQSLEDMSSVDLAGDDRPDTTVTLVVLQTVSVLLLCSPNLKYTASKTAGTSTAGR